MKTIAYIDAANLKKGLPSIDYKKFYTYLSEKHQADQIYFFTGYLKSQESKYKQLKKAGYTIVFKEAVHVKDGKTKANIDTELTLQATKDFYENDLKKGILISGDGDFACLLDFWKDKKIKTQVLAPQENYCSYLIKKRSLKLSYLDTPKIYNQISKSTQKQSIFSKILKFFFKR